MIFMIKICVEELCLSDRMASHLSVNFDFGNYSENLEPTFYIPTVTQKLSNKLFRYQLVKGSMDLCLFTPLSVILT